MNDADSIRQKIQQSVHRIAGVAVADIRDSSNFREDLGLDSLSALEVMVEIEYAFRIKIPVDRLEHIRTVQDTIQVVQEYLRGVQA
jgi:acyl carrier protein